MNFFYTATTTITITNGQGEEGREIRKKNKMKLKKWSICGTGTCCGEGARRAQTDTD
jgi:hypothetical protein